MWRILTGVLLSLGAIASVITGVITFDFERIDFPGTSPVFVNGINNYGDMVGETVPGFPGHGVLLRNGQVTLIDVPGSGDTTPEDINNRDEIAGYYDELGYPQRGFVYHKGTFRTIAVPGAIVTNAFGINDSGVVVGTYWTPDLQHLGFSFDGCKFTTISDPHSTPGEAYTEAFGINDHGEIVGLFRSVDDGLFHGFIYHDGIFRTLPFPAPAGDVNDHWMRINNLGQIIGGIDVNHFIYDHGQLIDISFPLPTNFNTAGINDLGQVVGYSQGFFPYAGDGKPGVFLASPARGKDGRGKERCRDKLN